MKLPRHSAILDLIRTRHVTSQEVLRELLQERGFEVAQATLSRDIQELGLVKARNAQGELHYASPAPAGEPAPTLSRLLPALYLSADGVRDLVVLKTLAGGAQPVAAAIDAEKWGEVVGTIAGDDTILLIVRKPAQRAALIRRIEALARGGPSTRA